MDELYQDHHRLGTEVMQILDRLERIFLRVFTATHLDTYTAYTRTHWKHVYLLQSFLDLPCNHHLKVL